MSQSPDRFLQACHKTHKNGINTKLKNKSPHVVRRPQSLSSGDDGNALVSQHVDAASLHLPPSFSLGRASKLLGAKGKIRKGPCDNPTPPAKKDEANVPEVLQTSLPLWCSMLTSQVLRSRSGFSSYLARSIQLSRGRPSRGSSAPTFFPIPIPVIGCFDRMPAALSNARRHALHMSRTVAVICMALNFWYSGGRSAPDTQLLRGPNKQHRCLFERIRSLLKSDGPATGFSIPSAGRRFPELCARLGEVSDMLTLQGVSNNPYDKSFSGVELPKDNSTMPELSPYRDLDPDRLVLHGTGEWDPCPYLSEDLKMAFREPSSLLVDIPPGPHPNIRDTPSCVASLARKWDQHGLLFLHRRPVMVEEQVRIFNAYKGVSSDRQIGDRRGRNSIEAKLLGPSSSLPAGVDLQDVFIDPSCQVIRVSITDRKDYYHQLKITESKALGNTVGPPIPVAEILKTRAYQKFVEKSGEKYHREKQGDHFRTGEESRCHCTPCELPGSSIWASFNSVLQGDHTGVEVATESHIALLQNYGLLNSEVMLVANKPLRASDHCQGLVIDDFFCLSVEQAKSDRSTSRAHQGFQKAQEAYRDANLLGSPTKDVDAEQSGKIIGAFVNAKPETLSRGLCTVGTPPEKRIALSHLTFELCKLSHTTDCLHLCVLGAWVSILCFRRPLMSLLNHSFRLVDINSYDSDRPKIIPLPRRVACELVLVATLCVFAVFDLAADYDPKIYCTDASSSKGAIVSSVVGRRLAEVLWKSMRSKGAYTRLLSPSEVVLQGLGELEPCPELTSVSVDRPLAYHYDFIEIYAGASLISDCLSAAGYVCGPPIELSGSPEYDMSQVWLIEWLTFLVSQNRLRAFFLCPPCTTFSIMRRPALRSKLCPFGYRPHEEKTRVGNLLAHRALQLMYVGAQNRVSGIVENPWSSFMKLLPAWRNVSNLPCAECVRADSCQFGSPHQKGFRFMSVHLSLSPVARRCCCKEKHLQVQGKYTKGSAVYTKELASQLALCISTGIDRSKQDLFLENSLEVKGLETQICNEIALSSPWTQESCWTFRKESHINILEMASVLRLVQKASDRCRAQRLVCMVDSHVTQGATSKGRTASLGLGSVLRRLNAMCVSSSIFLCIPYCPTRLNPADDPTRQRDVRTAVSGFDVHHWSNDQLFDLASLPRTRRWASGWVRLVIKMLGPKVLDLHRRDIYRQSFLASSPLRGVSSFLDPLVSSHFDSTLGFPGEGWIVFFVLWIFAAIGLRFYALSCSVACPALALVLSPVLSPSLASPFGSRGRCFLLLLCCACCSPAEAMPLFPQTAGERLKADARRLQGPIPIGRPVLPKTGSN